MPSVRRSTASRSRKGLAFLALSLVSYGVPRPVSADEVPLQIAEPTYEEAGQAEERPAAGVIGPEGLRHAPPMPAQAYGGEVEPNGTTATATPIVGTNVVIRANIFPAADVDFFSFTANAGDRVYAATMTSFSASGTNGRLTLFASDGTTIIENDEDNGSFAANSPSIAGATIPTTGTYFLRNMDASATAFERPYELHLRVQSGAPTPEVEPNDTPATANALPPSGWVSGARNPAAATEQDWYSFTANAGDTVYLALDLDPERDAVMWNGRLGIALFGDAGNQILVVDDNTADTIISEAQFMTVKTSGTYFAFVDSSSAAVGGPTATYHLSVSIHPAGDEGVNCTTYTSTDVPKVIGPAAGLTQSVITVPGNPRIADLDVSITLDHLLMNDIDAHLRSPANNDNGLFTDIGATVIGGQAQMDATFDDEAAIPPSYTVLKGLTLKPEFNYRLHWFDGEDAGGTWTLDLRDDLASNGGNLTAWSIRICEPPPPPTCPAGFAQTTVFTTDFEGGAAGFTHSGTADEWELGLPATLPTAAGVAPFNSCNSGTSCWKTDLDNTYNAAPVAGTNVTQDLLSPPINLAGLSAPIVVTWAHRHQIESASFDHYFIDARQVGGATPVRLFEWLDATPTNLVGNPSGTIGESSGWGTFSRRADSLAGTNAELLFHVDQDNTVQLAGAAIDDVTVTACRPLSADLSITKTDNLTTATPGGFVTYIITATNPSGGDGVPAGNVTDTFPGTINCPNWVCTGTTGGICSPSGTGSINDTVVLPPFSSVTYSATCSVGTAATGTLVNTATVSGGVVGDPDPTNNSATDTDTLVPEADIVVGMTVDNPNPGVGTNVTFTVLAGNVGPSDASGVIITDLLPNGLTFVSATPSVGSYTPGTGAWSIGNLGSAGSATLALTATVTQPQSLVNQATKTGLAVHDPNRSNDTALVGVNGSAVADIQVQETVDDTTPTSGQNVVFTVTARNAGPANATGVVLTDNLPAGLTFVSATPSQGTYASATGVWTVGAINNGSTATLQVVTTVTSTLTITRVVAKTAEVQPDPSTGNDDDSVTLNNDTVADLSLSMVASQEPVPMGATFTYTIVTANHGPAQATGVTVTDSLPAGLTFVSATPTQGSCTGTTNVSCTLGTLDDGGSASIALVVTKTVGGAISNTASVTATEGDPYMLNNTNGETTTPVSLIDIKIQ